MPLAPSQLVRLGPSRRGAGSCRRLPSRLGGCGSNIVRRAASVTSSADALYLFHRDPCELVFKPHLVLVPATRWHHRLIFPGCMVFLSRLSPSNSCNCHLFSSFYL